MAIVIRQRDASAARKDSYLDSLSKLIPGEVLVGYTTSLQFANLGDDLFSHVLLFALFSALTPAILFASAWRSKTSAPLLQYIVRTTAFVVTALKLDAVVASELGDLQWLPSAGGIVILALAAYLVTAPDE